jgi:DNA-binding transcriptional ArsR family regulator
MFKSNETRYRIQAHILKALAHPTRLYIIEELSKGEQCVCVFKDKVGVDMSTISKHLTILKNAGIISDSKKGHNVYYSLKMPCVMNFFSCVQDVIRCGVNERRNMLK